MMKMESLTLSLLLSLLYRSSVAWISLPYSSSSYSSLVSLIRNRRVDKSCLCIFQILSDPFLSSRLPSSASKCLFIYSISFFSCLNSIIIDADSWISVFRYWECRSSPCAFVRYCLASDDDSVCMRLERTVLFVGLAGWEPFYFFIANIESMMGDWGSQFIPSGMGICYPD